MDVIKLEAIIELLRKVERMLKVLCFWSSADSERIKYALRSVQRARKDLTDILSDYADDPLPEDAANVEPRPPVGQPADSINLEGGVAGEDSGSENR